MIAVTGVTKGAGASVLAANLAAAAALAGNATLLWNLKHGDRVAGTTIPRLFVMDGARDPFAGLFARRRIERRLRGLDGEHDLIVVDADADAAGLRAALVRRADAVVIAVRAAPGSGAALAAAIARLGDIRGAVLPVFAAYDRRKPDQAGARSLEPDWPVLPLGLVDPNGAVAGLFSPHSPAAASSWLLWDAVAPKLGLSR